MRVAAFTFSLSHFALIANVNEKKQQQQETAMGSVIIATKS